MSQLSNFSLKQKLQFAIAVVVILLAGMLVVRESIFNNPAFANSQLGRFVSGILGAGSDALPSTVSKLAQVNDNYHRCQNKLGIASQISLDEILNRAGGRFVIYGEGVNDTLVTELEAPLKQIFKAGMRYVSIEVQLAAANLWEPMAIAAGEFTKLANRNNLKPVFDIGPRSGSGFIGNPVVIENFIRTAADQAGGQNEFIVPAYPRAAIGFEQAGVIKEYSDAVARALATGTATKPVPRNAIITPPLMFMQTNPGCPGAGPVCVEFGPENDRIHLFADMNLFRGSNAEFDFNLYDMLLVGLDNYDATFKDFANGGVSKRSRLGSTHYQDDIKSWLKEYNDKIDAQKELQVLVMDFGPGEGTFVGETGTVLERLGLDFGIFSDDPTIAGVVLSPQLYNLAGLDNEFYSKLNLFGTNCNYDTVDYDTTYSASSAAPVCEAAPVADNVGGAAKTRFVCSENEDKCFASIQFTVQVGLPIRNFGSNSAIGTDTQPYMSPSARAAASASLPADFLNQFAGTLTSSSGLKYTVPWLGNGINSSKIGIGSIVTSLPNIIDLAKDISHGSYPRFATEEQLSESNNAPEFNNWTYNPRDNGKFNLRDEASICFGKDVCLNKVNISTIDTMRNYDPDKQTFPSGIAPRCGGQVNAVNSDPQNYVYGSEQIISTSSVEMSKAQLAYKIVVGEIESGFKPIANGNCVGNRPSGARCNFTNTTASGANACRLAAENIVSSCFSNLAALPTNYAQSEIYYSAEFPTASQFKIDGIYDALAANYNALQQAASLQGEKIIFNENWGWEADIEMRAYSIAPRSSETEGQANFGITATRKNNMLEFFSHSTPASIASTNVAKGNESNSDEGNSCKVGINYAIEVGGVNDALIKRTQEFGYSHALVIVTGTQEQKATASKALDDLCKANITPILRSCYTGNCGFTNGADQARYIDEVVRGAPSCQKVVATCGHNEPESENPNGFVNEGQWAASCVSTLKGLSSSKKIDITTPVFNSSHGELPTQLDQFFTGHNSAGFSFNAADYSCLALNAYSYANSSERRAIDHYNRLANDTRFGSLPICVMETGIAEPGAGVQDSLALQALDELLDGSRGRIQFALGFNWMGTNTSGEWKNFVMTDSNNDKAGQCQLSGGGGSTKTYSIPGQYFDNYNNYLAEGNNWQSEKHYYSMLGFIDEISRLYDIYALDTTGSRSLVDFTLNRPRSCSDPNIKAVLDAGYKVNCVAHYADAPDQPGYIEDPLGRFLCDKGYNVIGEKCNLICQPPQGGAPLLPENPSVREQLGSEICHPGNYCDVEVALGKNGYSYPVCREQIKVRGTDTYCNNLPDVNLKYGAGNNNLFNKDIPIEQRVKEVEDAGQRRSPTIGAFGTFMAANTVTHGAIRRVEEEISQWRVGDSYNFPSGVYKFVSYGGFNRRVESCLANSPDAGVNCLSMHSFGLAFDFNGDTNPFYASTRRCGVDIPPEFVDAMERNGFRWGGHFSGSDGTRFDPMHFEYNPNCITGAIPQDDRVTPVDGAPQQPYVCNPGQLGSTGPLSDIDALVIAVSNSIASSMGTPYPPEYLKATLKIETSLSDENGVPYGGDPLQQSYVRNNEADAAGPMQFVDTTFMGIIDGNRKVFDKCLADIGVTNVTYDPILRTYLGPAMCAGVIKHISNVRAYVDEDATLKTADDWFKQQYSSSTGQYYDWDVVNYQLSAIHIAARKYYGACIISIKVDGVKEIRGDYCAKAFDIAVDFRPLR